MKIDINVSVIVLLLVFILISVRQIGNIKLKISQIMFSGAIIILLTGQISFIDALKSINIDVMLFLFGMFVVGEALHKSGYITHISYNLFKRAKSVDRLILLILFSIGILSAFLMNDTLAIIGTPLVLYFAKIHNVSPKLLLLSLCFAVTIGSVMSPIGNPQNLLIALNSQIQNPFITFFKHLTIPTFVNLFLTYIILKIFYRDHFHDDELAHFHEPIKDKRLAFLAKISLILVIVLVFLKIGIFFLKVNIDFRLTYIALISALPIILFTTKRERYKVMRRLDWDTLIFFASMFVLMESVWKTGFFQNIIKDLNVNVTSISTILGISVIVSQLISNVPFVALYIPLINLISGSVNEMMALAAGSTIAGNLFILGAASNVIIIQNAEKKGQTLTFFEFAKVGMPLTIINVVVYWIFLC
jgi:Na+/H+ antiporter NhaD/arsenite permease-like protein